MIWGGKRYQGVRVYIGKQSGDFAGEYIVVYWCNGMSGGMLDAAVGVMAGDKYPNGSGGVSLDCLKESYRPLSYKRIPPADREHLVKWVI